jgi:hypothetical protein
VRGTAERNGDRKMSKCKIENRERRKEVGLSKK